MKKFFQLSLLLRLVGFLIGLISILGSIVAWSYSDSREPYRYPVAAFIMLCSGVLWLTSSFISKYQLSKKHFIVIFTTLLIGLLVGLVDVFPHCGGECGYAAGFCHLYLGYPGHWLRISNCMVGATGSSWLWILRGNWNIDLPSFGADLVFWSGVGLIVTSIWNTIKGKTNSRVVEI